MGVFMSTARARRAAKAKAKSDLIDREIQEESVKYKREVKILLIGSSTSDKGPLLKQMKTIYQSGFSQAELMEYRPIVYENVVRSAQALVLHMRNIGLECVEHGNRELAGKILDYKLDAAPGSSPTKLSFSSDIAAAIHQIWMDPVIPKIIDDENFIEYAPDSASFFDEVLRIGEKGYVPNETDVLRAENKATGITETRFDSGSLTLHIYDVGGQRSERKKWIHCFENVTSIIFCSALSDYDQILRDGGENPMTDSMVHFESVINSRWFTRTSILLFFTKIDVFKEKLPKVPLDRYFPEYTGGADINKAAKYILWKFMQANRARLRVYPHITQATDTENIRLVFAAVRETIAQNVLKDSGII